MQARLAAAPLLPIESEKQNKVCLICGHQKKQSWPQPIHCNIHFIKENSPVLTGLFLCLSKSLAGPRDKTAQDALSKERRSSCSL